MLENEKFLEAMIELGFTTEQDVKEFRGGHFVEGSLFGKQLRQLERYYRVWMRAKETV